MKRLEQKGAVEFKGVDAEEQQDISAIVHLGSWIVLGADEGSDLAVLSRARRRLPVRHRISLARS